MLTVLQIADTLLATMWTMLRISGVVMIAPLLGAVFIPARVRVLVPGPGYFDAAGRWRIADVFTA